MNDKYCIEIDYTDRKNPKYRVQQFCARWTYGKLQQNWQDLGQFDALEKAETFKAKLLNKDKLKND